MTSRQKSVHNRAIRVGEKYRLTEFEIIQILQEVESLKIHKALRLRSPLAYAMKYIVSSEPIALTFIAVARKSAEIPELKKAIESGSLGVFKANRIVSTLNKENAAELVQIASTRTWREMQFEIAKRNPRAAAPDQLKPLSEDVMQLRAAISTEDGRAFERVASLEAQRTSRSPSKGEVIRAALQAYLNQHDPVRRAERAQKRKEKRAHRPTNVVSAGEYSAHAEHSGSSMAAKSITYGKRTKLNAEQKHSVMLRHQGRCTHLDEHGRRCNQDRWVDVHHIVSVSMGGTNDPENLTVLCGFHHDLIHQLSLPIDGPGAWLRSPSWPYVCVLGKGESSGRPLLGRPSPERRDPARTC